MTVTAPTAPAPGARPGYAPAFGAELHRQELRHLGQFMPQGKQIWVKAETALQVELLALGLVSRSLIGPLAGCRYKWRWRVTEAGRAFLALAGDR